MNPGTVYVKTEKGKARFEARDIPTALRHALILVDGHSTLAELMRKGEGLENLADVFEMLEEMGLMAPLGSVAASPTPPPSAPSAATPVQTPSATPVGPVKRQLVGLAIRVLGDKAEKVIKKIDDTADSNIALMYTIDICSKMIKLTIDEKKGAAFLKAARDILNKQS
ncbi:MAG: hypothetical protein WBM09_06985 [Gallionella sp.]